MAGPVLLPFGHTWFKKMAMVLGPVPSSSRCSGQRLRGETMQAAYVILNVLVASCIKTGKINFNVFLLTQLPKTASLQHLINIKIIDVFTFFLY